MTTTPNSLNVVWIAHESLCSTQGNHTVKNKGLHIVSHLEKTDHLMIKSHVISTCLRYQTIGHYEHNGITVFCGVHIKPNPGLASTNGQTSKNVVMLPLDYLSRQTTIPVCTPQSAQHTEHEDTNLNDCHLIYSHHCFLQLPTTGNQP